MKSLNFTGPINSLGYGTASYNLLIELNKLYEVALWPIGQLDYPVPNHLKSVVQGSLDRQANFKSNAPSLRLWHQFDMAQHVGRGPKIGFPIFELNKFTDREKYHLNSLDEIFVCSTWAKQVIAEEIGREAKIVPLGVDRSIFYDTPADLSGPIIFLNVGKWEIRKGHDVLIEAFLQAFNEDDNVELWMMNGNPFLRPEQAREWENLYTNHPLKKKVKLLPRVQTQQELADIMRKAHCGVFPARAEGWNLEALEMMSCGRHVIVTDYSAHTDFCDRNNATMVRVFELEDAWDGIWFHGHGQWAKIDVDVLAKAMVMFTEYGLDKQVMGIFHDDSVKTAKALTWANSADIIRQHIERI